MLKIKHRLLKWSVWLYQVIDRWALVHVLRTWLVDKVGSVKSVLSSAAITNDHFKLLLFPPNRCPSHFATFQAFSSSSKQPEVYFVCLQRCLFWTFHVIANAQCVDFVPDFFHSTAFPRLVPILAHSSISITFIGNSIPLIKYATF